ncbi:hypothetical protein ZYGR_0AG05800 [Zygosaccharomyces rouxii]|uniref:Mitochondrial intermembrane space import and assembly protein 40 n=1 Tax=Zygosaccharomyces rouxii TaxID=4956 RepID=A0A1Q3AA09_ZYGRO|nr:hypothetical protein ZYGR_0AG05800 [Zygosaccharomyces rouxii]
MFRSIVSRGFPYRVVPLARASRGSLKRYTSSSSSNFNGGNNSKAITLGALVTLGSILFISPYNLKSLLPQRSANTQEFEKQPVEPEEPAAEEKPAESEEPAEPEQPAAEEKPAQPEQPKEDPPSQPSPEDNSDESEQGERATAYNPDTGVINWDCPCLGGMAHGPCGEEFKAAFSCFVYSEADPKGIDCIDKFQQMQDCFRRHPEHYAEQLKDEEEAAAAQESVEAEVAVSEPPVQSQPAQEQPAQEQPAQEQPAQEHPAQEHPAQELPAQEQPQEQPKDDEQKSSESSD